jgi:hypothetical protein
VSGGNVYVVGKSRDYWVTRRSINGGGSWATLDQYQLDTQWNSQANGVAADEQGNVYVVGEGMKGAKMSRTSHWVVRKLPAGGSTWATVDRWQLSPNVGWTTGSLAEDVVAGPGGAVHVVGRGADGSAGASYHYLTRTSADGGLTWATTDDLQPDADGNSGGYAITRDAAGNVLTAGAFGYSTGGAHLVVRTTAAPAVTPTVFGTSTITSPTIDEYSIADEILA